MEIKKEEVCIVSAGSVDAGKSTLMSVLLYGDLDNGRGLARQKMAKHEHELYYGRTSDVSTKLLKFNNKEIQMVDLCGHKKYLKTTMYGMHGFYPDYAILVVAANKGIMKMTKEHLGLLLYMDIPIIIAITREDIAPQGIYNKTIESLKRIGKFYGKKLIFVNKKKTDDFDSKDIIKSKKIVSELALEMKDNIKLTPVITVSSKTGYYIDVIKELIVQLKSRKHTWVEDVESGKFTKNVFYIDTPYNVVGAGLVLSGILKGNSIKVDDEIWIGPYEGNFVRGRVKSIHNNNRENLDKLENTQRGCIAVKIIDKKIAYTKENVRRGSIITTDKDIIKNICWEFEADIEILHHSTTISKKFCSVIHCGGIKQIAKIILPDDTQLRSRDKARVKFRFLQRPEYLEENSIFKFREGETKGTGRVISLLSIEDDLNGKTPTNKTRRKNKRATTSLI